MKSICHILTILAFTLSLATAAQADVLGCQIVTTENETSWIAYEGDCQEVVGMSLPSGETVVMAVPNLDPEHS